MVTKATTKVASEVDSTPLEIDDSTEVDVKEITTRTKSFSAKVKKDETTTENKNESVSNRAEILSNLQPIEKAHIPQNKLAQMFNDIKEYEEYENETFYAFVTRRADMMQDDFAKPCLTSQNFPPMQITSKSLLQFIPLIQKSNGNSGGRFDIVVSDSNGEQLDDVGINGFVIPNPVIEEKPLLANNGDNQLMIQFLQQMREDAKADREILLETVRSITAQKEDEFTAIIKEKVRNDILNPPENKGFNPNEFMAQFMMMPAIVGQMSEAMAKAMNKGEEKDKGIIATILENEALINAAGGILNNAMETFENIQVAKATAQNPNAVQQQQYAPDRSQEQPQPQQLTAEQEKAMKSTQQLISEILAELSSDRELNNENEKLQELAKEYPLYYPLIKQAAKSQPFEQLVNTLEQLVPEAFAELADENGVTEQGQHLLDRLEQFYNFLKEQ
jgi:hypothetical protein